ncbi:NAC domain-containing protein 53 [Eucalyptus grandis]|uniref:NAC domain-containing protein 53 n=1 Tax=Eucalyptus grandis TaxID=71139 RepID=UPI00192ED53A|nr:NAC domain-containing protein 53 [Eucalyptus grandis]
METRIYPISLDVKEIALSLQRAIVGYGFRPTEEELINYMKLEVPGRRESFCIIPTLDDIYKVNPWDLPAKFKENSIIPSNDQEWWFICPRMQTQRISRKTPCGYSWKITGSHKDIKAGNDDKKIGSKIPLIFQDGVQTNWVIHEYHLLDNDFNRNYVLCHLKRRRDEKADNSSIASDHGANYLVDLESYLHQPDHEGSFPEYSIQAMMGSLIEESPTVMDFTLDNGHTDDYSQLLPETGKEDEYMLFEDLFDADFFHGDEMQIQDGQTSNLHNEPPVLMKHQRTQTIDSLPGVVPLDGKKGMVENKFSSPLVVPKKPMALPVYTASVKYNGKDEVPRFRNVRQETVAQSIKPECIYLDETAARTKSGQISIMENRRTQTIGSIHGVFPLEQKKAIIQSKLNSSHVSSAKPMELLSKPMTPKMPEPQKFMSMKN